MKARSGADPRGGRGSRDDYAALYRSREGADGCCVSSVEENPPGSIQFHGTHGIFSASQVALFFSVRTSEIVVAPNAASFRVHNPSYNDGL